MHILLVEDEFLLAHSLSEEIRRFGDEVIGPFADVQEAMHHVDSAHAAILAIKLGDQTSFRLADALSDNNRPFLFLTGYARDGIPSRFDRNCVYSKPVTAQPLLRELHIRYDKQVPKPDELQDIVLDMLAYAQLKMPDKHSAERAVEAAMTTAIHQIERGRGEPDLRAMLTGFLEKEARAFKRRHLQ